MQQLITGADKEKWLKVLSNKYSHLTQGNDHGIKGMDTIEFIPIAQLPNNKQITYASFVCNHHPLKEEQRHIHFLEDSDKLTYQNDAPFPAAFLLETKLMINSTISDGNLKHVFSVQTQKITFCSSNARS